MAPCPPCVRALPCVRLWREEMFPHYGTIFLAISERHWLSTCIEEGLGGKGGARIGAHPAYATGRGDCAHLSILESFFIQKYESLIDDDFKSAFFYLLLI